ncbi:MAG TPA: hypothetical protein VFT98_00985 [Myxococcota bacterium]|nr:hypothetical protein [Myxococcota bacterium]
MSDDEITPEHTSARVGQLLSELEALRLEVGRSKDARVPMQVRDASPREVFYHAQTVHRKANQLVIELGGRSVDAPSAETPARARPADVLKVLDSARERLAEARSLLRIEGDTSRPDLPGPLIRDAGKTATDALTGCLLASRQLNAMLAHAFASPEAHELLVRGEAICERLLAVHAIAMPPAPPFERRKSPREVFQVLWQACETLQRALHDSKLPALELDRGYVGEQPTDVYDLASLVLSELEYVASFVPTGGVPTALTPAPPHVLPAHNYQRARRLQAGIEKLAAAVRTRPEWLQDSTA